MCLHVVLQRLPIFVGEAYHFAGLLTCLHQKTPDLDSSHKAYTYKKCITKYEKDIKTRQKN